MQTIALLSVVSFLDSMKFSNTAAAKNKATSQQSMSVMITLPGAFSKA
jgi:hypothetical protein